MGLEKVIAKIESEGEEKVNAIIQDAHNQSKEIIEKTKKTIDEKSKKKKQEIEKHLETLRLQEKSSIEIDTKKIRLNAQKEILDATYDQCLKEIESLPHEKIISNLLKKSKDEMSDAFYIYSNKNDEKLIRSISKLNYAGNIDCIGGVVIENKDRTMKLDYRYETIAAMLWEHHLGDIAEKLFG